jgi:hypothetical protein
MMERLREGFPWAGLAASSTAWALSTQLNYVFATVHCNSSGWLRAGTVITCLLISVVGIVLSWPAWSRRNSDVLKEDVAGSHPRRMIAGISVLAAVLFAVTIAAQAVALMILGCKP